MEIEKSNAGHIATKSVPTMYPILFAISAGHLLNDSIQTVVPALYPILKSSMDLSYTQIGFITFALNMTSSVMQPVFGYTADRKSTPYLLPFGMFISLIGVLSLSLSSTFTAVLLSVLLIGIASSIFHPEGSRVAFMASGSNRGLSQAIYQVGGNTGNSLAPIFTAFIFVKLGQIAAIGFTIPAFIGLVLMLYVSKWYAMKIRETMQTRKQTSTLLKTTYNNAKSVVALLFGITILRSLYGAGIGNFYQFYLMHDYGISTSKAQIFVFIFMISGVLGTFAGGHLADRYGKKNVIFFSMILTAPFALILPYMPLVIIAPLFFFIGFISSTSFSVIVVYAQELLPGRIGTVAGLITGMAFGVGAIGAVILGNLADSLGLPFIMIVCSFLPLIGSVSWFLPDEKNFTK